MSTPGSRLLITGATGYLGTWALRHWRARHPEAIVWAASDRAPPVDFPAERYRQVDLRDFAAVAELVLRSRPTHVVHLAGLIREASLADYLSVNVVGTDHLYRALADAGLEPRPRIVQAGSAAMYGRVDGRELPIREDQQLRPLGDYALSKACQDQLAVSLGCSRGLDIVRARLFNVLGPGQPDDLVPMTFIRQLRRCAAGEADRLEVGNTKPRRDFVDARDVVEALDGLLECGRPGEAYNVGAGRDVSIGELIDQLLEISGLDVPVVKTLRRQRAVEVARVSANVTRIAADTGWKASISLRQSLEAMWTDVSGEGLSERLT